MDKMPLSQDSNFLVYNPSIEFFLNKILMGEYCTFSRQLHGFWDAIIGAMILDPSLRKIETQKAYLKALSVKMVQAKSAMTMLRYDSEVYFDVLSMITSLDQWPDNFFFGVSDIDFYPEDEPPYSTQSFTSHFDLFHLLKTRSPLRCFPLKYGDRQIVMQQFLPPGFTPFNGIIWRKYGYHQLLLRFFDHIRHHRIVIIGPHTYYKLGRTLGLEHCQHIEIHPSKACEEKELLLKRIQRSHSEWKDKAPTVYFFVAGTLGTWLTSKLHGVLEHSFLLDVGLALDSLLDDSGIAKENPYHFSGYGKETGKPEIRYKTSEPGYFKPGDPACYIQVKPGGVLNFHMRKTNHFTCHLKCIKTRLFYGLFNRLKVYKYSNWPIIRKLIRLYRA